MIYSYQAKWFVVLLKSVVAIFSSFFYLVHGKPTPNHPQPLLLMSLTLLFRDYLYFFLVLAVFFSIFLFFALLLLFSWTWSTLYCIWSCWDSVCDLWAFCRCGDMVCTCLKHLLLQLSICKNPRHNHLYHCDAVMHACDIYV